ncbi:hypothetical protein LTR53_017207 [Teratosphaeriaceae sp. CCFEE 6253]|nr:hypothetical protein LTR53_017207 [Teratosphaeriaceae sp. CCFEE 6253]
MNDASFRLLDLPFELRHRILSCALESPHNALELQSPLWGGAEAYAPPLFRVSRGIRAEALRAFYETNTFLWLVDLSVSHRSDPASYPGLLPGSETGACDPDKGGAGVLPALPWLYPHLLRHLRHVNVTIYLPQNGPTDPDAAALRKTAFHAALERLVLALDYGRRLRELRVLLTAKHFLTDGGAGIARWVPGLGAGAAADVEGAGAGEAVDREVGPDKEDDGGVVNGVVDDSSLLVCGSWGHSLKAVTGW